MGMPVVAGSLVRVTPGAEPVVHAVLAIPVPAQGSVSRTSSTVGNCAQALAPNSNMRPRSLFIAGLSHLVLELGKQKSRRSMPCRRKRSKT